jgi:hypothetical protein
LANKGQYRVKETYHAKGFKKALEKAREATVPEKSAALQGLLQNALSATLTSVGLLALFEGMKPHLALEKKYCKFTATLQSDRQTLMTELERNLAAIAAVKGHLRNKYKDATIQEHRNPDPKLEKLLYIKRRQHKVSKPWKPPRQP